MSHRVLVLRPVEQSAAFERELVARGLVPVVAPAIRIVPIHGSELDRALGALQEYDWAIFTSSNGAETFAGHQSAAPLAAGGRPKVGAIGPGTAETLRRLGIRVDWIPSRFTTESIAEELPASPPARLLLVRAEIADRDLDQALGSRGFHVERIDAYRTEPADPEPIRQAVESGIDAVALTSASIAESFVAATGGDARGAAICSIGPATTAACRRAGLNVDLESPVHTVKSLADEIASFLSARSERSIR